MNRPTQRAILLGVLVLSIVGIVFLAYSTNVREKAELHAYIDRVINEYKREETPYIDFATLDYSRWDKMYVFGPYSFCESIINTLNSPSFWLPCKLSGIEDYENRSLFVFVEDSSVKKYVVYGGITVKQNNNAGYPRERAHFIFDANGRLVWQDGK